MKSGRQIRPFTFIGTDLECLIVKPCGNLKNRYKTIKRKPMNDKSITLLSASTVLSVVIHGLFFSSH